ncbi:MAG: pimeloyl-ACP methyl ester carboxylesterase [Flavobacteriales bacterium]|jgi:pimeloyl-ACP methyl ester carboxylesterase
MKKIMILCTLSAWISTVDAQTSASGTFFDELHNKFTGFNMSQASTGIVTDLTLRMAPLEWFDGTLQTNRYVSSDLWKAAYLTLYTSQLDNVSTLQHPSNTYRPYYSQATETTPIPVGILHYHYNKLKPDAYVNAEIDYQNGHYVNVANKNPISLHTLFAAAPVLDYVTSTNVTFSFPAAMQYTNVGASLTTLSVDFGDGNGFTNVSVNGTQTINYQQGGLKTLVFKATYTNGIVLQSHTQFMVDVPIAPKRYPFIPDNQITFTPTASHSGGTLYIGYGCNNTTISKPLLVVEGFDSENTTEYNSFLGKLLQINNGGNELNDLLDNEGYDYMYLDYNNPTDDIRRNAALLEDVLGLINERKELNNSAEKNVVIGESMGGLVARYALRKMELANKDHEVEKYISLDAPHRGANIPQGIQALVAYLNSLELCVGFAFTRECINLSEDFPDISKGLTLLNSTAARQMLMVRSTHPSILPSLFNQFQTEINQLGFPQNTKQNIAISNGSQDGVRNPDVTIGSPLLSLHITADELINNHVGNKDIRGFLRGLVDIGLAGVDFGIDIYPLPGKYDNQSFKNLVCDATLSIQYLLGLEATNYPEYKEERATTTQYDNAAGGLYSSSIIVGEIADPLIASKLQLVNSFCFIPTNSALALNGGYNQLNRNLRNLDLETTNFTSFDNYTAPLYTSWADDFDNEGHTNITVGNATFITDLLANPNFSLNNTQNLIQDFNFGVGLSNTTSKNISNNVTVTNSILNVNNEAINVGLLGTTIDRPIENEFELVVNENCFGGKSTLTLNNSSFVIGSGNHQADVTFNDNAELIVNYGGQLVVNDGSELIFKSGANFILKSGSSIDVNGSGKIIIETGANFLIEAGSVINLNNSVSEIRVYGNCNFVSLSNNNFSFLGEGQAIFHSGNLNINNNTIIIDGVKVELVGVSELNLVSESTAIIFLNDGELIVESNVNWNGINNSLTIEGQGALLLSPENDFILNLTDNNGLILNSGSTLILAENTRLNYGVGSTIKLNEGVLVIRNKMEIATGATFTFSSDAGYDNGTLRFAPYEPDYFMVAGRGSRFVLPTSTSSKPVLDIQENTSLGDNFQTGDYFDRVELSGSHINVATGKYLHTGAPVLRMDRTTITGGGTISVH